MDRQITSLERVGVKISTFDIGLSHSPIGLIKKWLELRKLVRMLNPDLLHGRYGTIVGLVTAFVGKPSVISFCGGDLLLGASIPLFRQRVGVLLSNLAALRAKRLICVSEELREALWWRKSRTIVIPDGVDLDLFSPGTQETARRELGWNAHNPIVLLNVRNDPKAKGLDLAKAAIQLAQLRIPDAELCVIENVAPDRMPLHYQAADALLCLSLSEGSPNVVKEALACNLPVISTLVGDVPERLAGVQPSAVVERDVEAIAKAMVQILQHRKRSNGREHVRSLSLENIAQRIVDVYQTALDKESNENTGLGIPRLEAPIVVPITNEEMLKNVAGIHLEAFAGYLNAQFGRGYAKAFVRWFSKRKGAIAIAAVDSNRNVIGYALGAPVGYGQTLNRELFWSVAGRIILRPWLFLNPQLWKVLIARVKILLGLTQTASDVLELPEPSMSLVAIGVVPTQRRGKIGQRLMEAFEARARESQMRSAVLSVYENRTAARRFYEKCGWQPDGTQAGGGTVMRYFKMFQSDHVSSCGSIKVSTRSIDSTN
ncbi:MAG: GNAT family N-acetyltransferase [Nitrospirota bacterium]